MVKAHNQAELWQTKRQILSIFANDFTRTELQTLIPGLSKWRIDQARQHSTEAGEGQLVPGKPIFRTRIDPMKVDHFINYISRPDLLQDVAFGTKTLKLDSGEHIIILAVIRTLIPSRITSQYTSYCKQQEFVPTSERSLFRILEICSASMQKSLHGLDNVTADRVWKGGPDPAFPLLFHENPASRTFFIAIPNFVFSFPKMHEKRLISAKAGPFD